MIPVFKSFDNNTNHDILITYILLIDATQIEIETATAASRVKGENAILFRGRSDKYFCRLKQIQL